jgi:hypothetical protein
VEPRRLLARIARGSVTNVEFRDFCRLVEAFGFELLRTAGSHRLYGRQGIPELVNLQDVAGQAKPYQIRQFLRLVERYGLRLEDR